MEFYAQISGTGQLLPLFDNGKVPRLRIGEIYLCKVSIPRNLKFHRKFFALLNLAFLNMSEHLQKHLHISSQETLLDYIKLGIGHFDIYEVDGISYTKTRSISFSDMDEAEFEAFYNQAIDFILQYVAIGAKKSEFVEEIERNFK